MAETFKGLLKADIASIPSILEDVRADLLHRRRDLMAILRENAGARVLLTGCGSSYSAALYGQFLLRRYTPLHATAVQCTDLLCHQELYLKEDVPLCLIYISRSGTTTETVLACERFLGRGGVRAYSVTCSPSSPLARLASPLFSLAKASDQAMPMTRSLEAFCYMFAWLASSYASEGGMIEALDALPERMGRCLDEHDRTCREIALEPGIGRYALLGGGPLSAMARDGALKFCQFCSLPAIALQPMEYIHGFVSAAGGDQMAILLASEGGARFEEYVLHRLSEIGEPTAVLSATAAALAPGFRCLDLSPYAGGNDFISGLYYSPMLWLMAACKAESLGMDPDAPRHAARAVHIPHRP
ncbi:MAG: SIS domain-containing protein [Planctomycetota bacterium]|nr:SIS domain-containing protein [Planctomycetota bacterium]